jgi:hypothetical protein
VRHEPIHLKGKAHIRRTYATRLKSLYYRSFVKQTSDFKYRVREAHVEKLFTRSFSNSCCVNFNKCVFDSFKNNL